MYCSLYLSEQLFCSNIILILNLNQTFDEEDPLGFQNVCLKMVSNGINIVEEICKLPEL